MSGDLAYAATGTTLSLRTTVGLGALLGGAALQRCDKIATPASDQIARARELKLDVPEVPDVQVKTR